MNVLLSSCYDRNCSLQLINVYTASPDTMHRLLYKQHASIRPQIILKWKVCELTPVGMPIACKLDPGACPARSLT